VTGMSPSQWKGRFVDDVVKEIRNNKE
jgi:hypothetical protein